MGKSFSNNQLRAIHARERNKEDRVINQSIEKYNATAKRLPNNDYLVTVKTPRFRLGEFPNEIVASKHQVPSAARMVYDRTIVREQRRLG